MLGFALLVLASGAHWWVSTVNFGASIPKFSLTPASLWDYWLGGIFGQPLSAIFLSCLAWLPIRFIRGAANAPDIRRFTLYGGWILFGIFALNTFLTSPQPTQLTSERSTYMSGFKKTCLPRVRSIAIENNAAFTEGEIHQYCSCYGEKVYQTLSGEELISFIEGKPFSDVRLTEVIAIESKCAEQNLGKINVPLSR